MSSEAINLLTFIIALLALLMAVASLIVATMSHIYTGARVKVTSGHGYIPPNFEDPLITIEARNLGRAPVVITGYGLEIRDGQGGTIPGYLNPLPVSPPVPMTLLGGHAQTWYLREAGMVEALRSSGRRGGVPVAPFVTLGTGKAVYAKRRTLEV